MPGFVVGEKDPEALDAAVGPQTAAVLLEPIQGEGGVLPLSEELLQAARAACDREGAALIFDEVQTGMGRTGTLWAYEQTRRGARRADQRQGARAAGCRSARWSPASKLADTFQPGDHGSTFAGGPVACAAALVALEICSDRELLAHVRGHG